MSKQPGTAELLDQPPPAGLDDSELRWAARRLNLAVEAVERRWGPSGRKRLVALLRVLADRVEQEVLGG